MASTITAGFLKGYASRSRAPRYSILFALPLLLLYEAGSLLIAGDGPMAVRNGADVLLKSVFVAVAGRHGLTAFGVLLLGTGAALVWRDRRAAAEPIDGRTFGVMLAESAALAVVFGIVVGWLTAMVLNGPRMLSLQGMGTLDLPTQLVVSLGAGIYEELLFRVVLVGLLLLLFQKVLGAKRGVAVALAVVASALIFSAFHYIGPLGDRLTLASFTFRAIAGLAFSALYVARGLGITAWTHALYDVGLTGLQSVS